VRSTKLANQNGLARRGAGRVGGNCSCQPAYSISTFLLRLSPRFPRCRASPQSWGQVQFRFSSIGSRR
jgi:hypothetical protein